MIKFIIERNDEKDQVPAYVLTESVTMDEVKAAMNEISCYPGEYTVKIEGKYIFSAACTLSYAYMMQDILQKFEKNKSWGEIEKSVFFAYLANFAISEAMTMEAGEKW